MKTELEILKEKVREIEKKQYGCKHEWGEVEYDPYEKDITREEFVYLGSDSYYMDVPTGRTYKADRWSRICKKCGKKEYAYEKEVTRVVKERYLKFR